jgi:hypothetical protein
VISSLLLRWWMSSFDEVCEGAVDVASIVAALEV